MVFHSKRRFRAFVSILLIVPIGFAAKFYTGPSQDWVRNSLGGVLYVIFWCLLLFFLFQRMKPVVIAAIVLAATSSLEFLQLWHPPPLEYLRNSFIGQTILGTTFSWSDFPYYFIGAAIGWAWLRMLTRRSGLSLERLQIDIR